MAGTSTFGGFEIARSGMLAYNTAVQTTAHNVANIETKGYSRQVANMQSLVCNKSSYLVKGSGVWVTDISRQRDEYYDTKYQAAQSSYSRFDTEQVYLKELESLLAGGITSDSDSQALITNAFATFNNTLSSLVGKPNDGAVRRQCVTTAQTFTEFVQNVGDKLQQLQDQVNTQIDSCVDQINSYAEKIVSLTRQINTIETYGNVANDLRDQRTVLIDELSQYCSVEAVEKSSPDGIGNNQFYVFLNGGTLVDTYIVNKLSAVQKDTYSNINDIRGCYNLMWADGTEFNEYNTELGGQLQALFEIRDGNNKNVLEGTVTGLSENTVTVTGTNVNNVYQLNIPASDGEITVGGFTYAYSSFHVQVVEEEDEEGNKSQSFSYVFELRDFEDTSGSPTLVSALENGYGAQVGTEVDFRGIPYYMAQINELVRTYSERFNEIHKQAYDQNDNQGIDFFNAVVPSTGENYVMRSMLAQEDGEEDGEDESGLSFYSLPERDEESGVYYGSYYYMTAVNFCVTKAVLDDPSLVALKEHKEDGSDNSVMGLKLSNLKDDADMFVYGAPDEFIQAFTSTAGIDCNKSISLAESQSNLLYMVDSNRKSIFGVDEDEEGTDLMVFQRMLYNQYKAMSVLAEVLDRLIDQTGV